MRIRPEIIALALGVFAPLLQAEEWEVTLLKPRGCTQCTFVEESLKRSAQLREAVLEDGAGGRVTARIQRRSSSLLSDQEWIELRALPWFDERNWRQQAAALVAQILLKRDGVVVSAGQIADSADFRDVMVPLEITAPDTGRDPVAVGNARAMHVSDLYLRSWNLEWFYRLALDPGLARTRTAEAWISAHPGTLPTALGSANVMLISTASGAADNEIFNALRIEEIRDVLSQSLALDPAQLRIFYGSEAAGGANALEVRTGRLSLVRRNVADATAFTSRAALRIFHSMREQPGSRNLLVLVGHGNPEGAGLWGSPAALSPDTLRALHEHGRGDNVLVSGNCFGGVMARATSCGFFAARPDIVATGCQADAAEVAQSRDYLHVFFSSLLPTRRTAADADGNGVISFAEAHWHASAEGDPRNVTYTSIDALADAYFQATPGELPASLTVREVLALAPHANAAEHRALTGLLANFSADQQVALQDLAAQADNWHPGSTTPRPMVGQLARRLLFSRAQADKAEDLAALTSCEARSMADFLKP